MAERAAGLKCHVLAANRSPVADPAPAETVFPLADLARLMHERSISAKRRYYCSRFDCSDAGWANSIDAAVAVLVVCTGSA